MARDVIGMCEFCEDAAVVQVNDHKGCYLHVDDAVYAAAETMRLVREAFDRHFGSRPR